MVSIYYTILHNHVAPPARQHQHIYGRRLLTELLTGWGIAGSYPLSLLDIDSSGKPSFNSYFDFSIAHSDNAVLCAGTQTGRIGIDAEQIKPIGLALYEDYFTVQEWNNIMRATAPETVFYNQWVRKEAVMKATGLGISLPMQETDVRSGRVRIAGTVWHLHDIAFAPGYACCIATDIPCNSNDIILHKTDVAE